MKSLLCLLIACLGVEASRHSHRMTPEKFGKWHEFFVDKDPVHWASHESKLTAMCAKVEETLSSSEESETPRRHLSEVLNCCQLGPGTERRDCFVAIQRGYADFCCTQRPLSGGGKSRQCCEHSSTARYSCFHRRSLSEADCSPAYTFDEDYRAESEAEAEEDAGEEIAAAVEEAVNAHPFSSLAGGSQDLESSPAPDLLSLAGLRSAVGDEGMECLEDLAFPNIDALTHIDSAGEMEEASESGRKCCGPCCKVGAFIGKRRLRPRRSPFVQCRGFWERFYREHHRQIRHPKCCGFAFVACCERQHYKEQALAGPIDEPIVEVELEPLP